MQILIAIMFCSVALSTFLVRSGLPGFTALAPEVISAITAVCVVVIGAKQGFSNVQPKYWIVFALLAAFIICGIVVNEVATGPIVAGLRYYLRAIPFFLLPAVVDIREGWTKRHFWLLTFLCLLQSPMAAIQRKAVMDQNRYTGDGVIGTLQTSGSLSVFLVCAACVLVGLEVRRGLLRPALIVLLLVFLFPTMINETKVTVFLVPLGLLTTAFIGTMPGRRLRVAGAAAAFTLLLGSIFIPVYNAMQVNNPYPQTISLDLLTDNKKNYLEKRDAGVGARTYVGRGDAFDIPLRYVTQDTMKLAFGLGIGNANVSALGPNFSGKYGSLFEFVATTSFALFVLELGIPGTILVLLLHWFVFRDSVTVARTGEGLVERLAVGWVGVSVVMGVALFYIPAHAEPALAYPFWYFAGVIAARRAHLLQAPASRNTGRVIAG